MKQKMDHYSEKLLQILGGELVIAAFVLWMLFHDFITANFVYVNFISDVAILLGFLILRGQNVQSSRVERNLQTDLKKSDEVLKKLK